MGNRARRNAFSGKHLPSKDLNVRIRVTTTLVPSSVVGAISVISRRKKRIETGTSQSNSAKIRSRHFLSKAANIAPHSPAGAGELVDLVDINDTIFGEGDVAIGLRYEFTDEVIDIAADMAIISPDMRQSFLLSSSTVFMFSIQIASCV